METNDDAIRILDAAGEAADPPAGFVRRVVVLPVRDEALRVAADVPDRPMRLAEVVPLVHAIDDRLMAVYLRHAAEQRREIFCRKGCSACCERFLIIFSPAEMYYVRERMDSLPADGRRRIEAWLGDKLAAARRTGLIERLGDLRPGEDAMDVIERWWRDQDATACPFLVDGACGIYEHRFVACREYYSHAPATNCARRATARMPIPLNLVNLLWRLEQRLTGRPTGAVSLPFMGMWAELRREEAQQTWPAVEMVDALLGILTDTADAARQLSAGATVDREEPGPQRGEQT